MTKYEFWQTMVDNMQGYDCIVVCTVNIKVEVPRCLECGRKIKFKEC